MKKFAKFVSIIALIFIIGGAGAAFFEHYLFPIMGSTRTFSKYDFFKKAKENITVINKTEQLEIKEDEAVSKIAAQPANALVKIISLSSKNNADKAGNGLILTSDGVIVTYRSAILETDAAYKVLSHSGSVFEAEFIGIDEFSNLAFLKMKASNLPVVAFANSDESKPGKKLIVIGNSQGNLNNSISTATMNDFDRGFNISGNTLSSSEKLEGVIKADFFGRQEFVGSPVVNYNGELIGLTGMLTINNKEKYFIIPSNEVRRSMESVIKNELGKRPFFGIYYIPITKEYSIARNLNRDRGALVYSPSGAQGLAVLSGSPAEKAGIRLNDIIIAINGKEVNLDNPFSNALSQYKKGDEIELLVVRNGNEIKIKVKL